MATDADTTLYLQLPLLFTDQQHKEHTVNESLLRLDILLHGVAEGLGVNTPPPKPWLGACYLVGELPESVFQGHAHHVAFFYHGWRFIAPSSGMRYRVRHPDPSAEGWSCVWFNGQRWEEEKKRAAVQDATYSDGTAADEGEMDARGGGSVQPVYVKERYHLLSRMHPPRLLYCTRAQLALEMQPALPPASDSPPSHNVGIIFMELYLALDPKQSLLHTRITWPPSWSWPVASSGIQEEEEDMPQERAAHIPTLLPAQHLLWVACRSLDGGSTWLVSQHVLWPHCVLQEVPSEHEANFLQAASALHNMNPRSVHEECLL